MSIFDSFEVNREGVREAIRKAFTFGANVLNADRCEQATDAVVEGINNGSIEIKMEEGYDSCGNCGGYHSVHYRCS